MLEIHGFNPSNFPQAFMVDSDLSWGFLDSFFDSRQYNVIDDAISHGWTEEDDVDMRHYKILRAATETFKAFMLRVFNEAMLWECHLISVDVTEYCVDIIYK
jgi:hypothetical protein